MCIACEIIAQRQRAAREAEELAQQNGQAEAPVAPVNYELESELIDLDRQRAEVRAIDADTILKLANAAKQLYTANLSTDGVTRLLGLLTTKPDEQVEAVQPEPGVANQATPAEEPAAPSVPQELLDIAKAMGWDVQDIQVVSFPKL